MNKREPQPFIPYITVDQILAFDKSRPETSTGSPFVDRVLSLFSEPGLRTGEAMGKFLGLKPTDISSYLLIATGHRLNELRRLWTLHEIEKVKAAKPYYTEDDVAQAVGFKDHSSLSHFLHAKEYNRKQNEHRQRIEEMSRMHWFNKFANKQ